MATLIVQGGTSLYRVNTTTGAATALTLPTGVTLSTSRKPRFAVLNQWVVLVNSPSKNLCIDPEGTVRVMVPTAPAGPPIVAAGSGTGLTGAYTFWQSFVVKNSDDELLIESPLSPASASVTLANQNASVTKVARSVDDITARRIYRSLSGGSLPYWLLDIEGNSAEAFINNTSDATMALLPSLTLTTNISPPGTLPGSRLKLICEWRSRLWGVSDDPALVDTVYVSETNKIYAWPNTVVANPTGADEQGVVALAPRRNQLGLLKRIGVWAIEASSNSTGVSLSSLSVRFVGGSEEAGCAAPDSVIVVNNKAYWMGNTGIWEWSDEGLKNITDETVKPWFATDDYFNRSRFPNAFARYNKLRQSIEFHVAAAGSSTEDRWVSFNLVNRRWYGPHTTAAFTPSHATQLIDANGLPLSFVGGTDGIVYQANSATFTDGASSAIDFDCYGPFHSENQPDLEKYWGELSVLSKIESGGTLTVTPYVGRLNAAAGSTISHDLTTGRQRLRRLGDGALCRLRFQQATNAQGVALYGYEINPVFPNGRR